MKFTPFEIFLFSIFFELLEILLLLFLYKILLEFLTLLLLLALNELLLNNEF